MKIIKNILAIIVLTIMILGTISLIGWAWDNSPTTIYQDNLARKGAK